MPRRAAAVLFALCLAGAGTGLAACGSSGGSGGSGGSGSTTTTVVRANTTLQGNGEPGASGQNGGGNEGGPSGTPNPGASNSTSCDENTLNSITMDFAG